MNASFFLKPVILAGDLMAEADAEKRWLVPGFLEQGDRVIVTGNEGEGKSTLLRQWAIQIAAGINPLTLLPCEPRTVLLMDLENTRQQIKEECGKIVERSDCELSPLLNIGNWMSGLEFSGPLANAYESELRRILDEVRPDVVIGGPLYKMASASLSDENVSRSVSAVLDRLREYYNFALILEAHQVNESLGFDPKAQKFRADRPMRPFGSSLWRRWPEFGLCLTKDGTLYHWRGDRQFREWPARFQRDGDTWLWEPDTFNCPVCGNERPAGKIKYCSERCANTAKKRRQRAKPQTEYALRQALGLL